MRAAYLILAIVTVVLVAAIFIGAGRPRRNGTRDARILLLAAVAVAVVIGAVLLAPVIDDSGTGFAVAVTAGPVMVAAAPAVALHWSRPAALVALWLAVPVLFAFVVVFALGGIGLFYLPVALLVLAAAVVLTGSRVPGRSRGAGG